VPDLIRYEERLFNHLEMGFNCGGICEKSPYYVFSTVSNKGYPTGLCKVYIIEMLTENAK
jgi:hypothetical protein